MNKIYVCSHNEHFTYIDILYIYLEKKRIDKKDVYIYIPFHID